jgi:hypothetical protein
VTILTRISCEETMTAARSIWISQETADCIGANALQVLAKASGINLRFFNGKASRSLLGGLFYLLSFRFNAEMTQSEIAYLLGISEVSVRKSYRDWLDEFPYFFTDLTVKMNSHQAASKGKATSNLNGSSNCVFLAGNAAPSFDDLLRDAIDDAFSSVSEQLKAALYFHLENTFQIKKSDIPLRIVEFSDALEKIFGAAGSRHLEILIMKTLFDKLKAKNKLSTYKLPSSEWLATEMTFQRYLTLARHNFEAKSRNKTEAGLLIHEKNPCPEKTAGRLARGFEA